MSNRLKIFRERMAAFEGAANPQEAIESGYYVRAPGKLLAETLSARVALRPASSHLLIGGIGSGKTTQLLVACEKLKEIGDIYPIYIDVSLHTDISKITSGVLTAIAGVELSKLLKDSEDYNIQYSITEIRKVAYGYSEKVNISQSNLNKRNNIQYEKIKHQGIIPSKHINSFEKNNLISAVSKLISHVTDNYGIIVLLFDGLDRLNNDKTFLEIVDSDIEYISENKIGIVLAGPLSCLYRYKNNPIENSLNYFYRQPCFDVENDSEAYNFFVQIIKARSQDNFIEESAIDLLVRYSGGVLRDLVNLTQAAIEETYISGDEKTSNNYVLNAIESLGKSQILGLSNEELEVLQIVMKKGQFIPRTDQDIKLLVSRRIIEYIYPKQRYAVHPAIVPIIEQIYA
ncbi:MAG: hypothetical protein MJK14_15560 [Rivularia sp. ALOHA_DT_140]|nr:hypothetical protein [Rivularia sp. ALOHA_DT_140]